MTNPIPKSIICGNEAVPLPVAVHPNGNAYVTTGPLYCFGDLPDGSRWRTIIPAGFWSDGPSMPLPVQALFWINNTGPVFAPGLLHDWMFRNAGAVEVGIYPATVGKTGKRRWRTTTVHYTRRECNLLMLAAMVGHGVPWWTRRKVMLGLLLGSRKPWRKHFKRNEAVAKLAMFRECNDAGAAEAAWAIARRDVPDLSDPTDTWWAKHFEEIREALLTTIFGDGTGRMSAVKPPVYTCHLPAKEEGHE